MKKIDGFLLKLMESNGCDIHLDTGYYPVFRKDGELWVQKDQPLLNSSEVEEMAEEILGSDKYKTLKTEKNFDFAYEMFHNGEKFRFRGNVYYQKRGLNLALRLIPNKIPTLEDLSLPQVLEKLTHYHQGMVLATGPAGSGKTATLAALVNMINEQRPDHIITIEDPIEYVHKNKKSLINQRQVGQHVDSFQTALRAALREDPDVILVGELRDLETIQMAITAADTGHLVLGTLHTNSAAQTIERLVGSFPVEQQSQIRTMLSDSLRGVISQQLVPKKDGAGRVVAAELLFGTLSVSNMIKKHETHKISSIIQTSRNIGMRSMDDSLLDLYKNSVITKEDARERLVDKSLISIN